MRLPAFDYLAPGSLEDALKVLEFPITPDKIVEAIEHKK